MRKFIATSYLLIASLGLSAQITKLPETGKVDAGFSLSTLRKLSNTSVTNNKVFYLNEAGREGFFQYDQNDTSSKDNTGTVIVTASGQRLKRIFDTVLNVRWFGAKGDGKTDDTQAIINAIAAIPPPSGSNDPDRGGQIFFPKCKNFYRITRKIIISTNAVQVAGENENVVIRNYGTGQVAFEVTGQYNSFRDIAIWGDGGKFGVGGTTSYGIHLKNANNFKFFNVNIRYHGSHGIYCSDGVWVGSFISTEVAQNLGDGVNSISPNGGLYNQNGNNFSFVNCTLAYNTGSGLNWKASALNVTGCALEQNKSYGILVNCTGLTNSAYGMNITGNYFEANSKGEMRFVSVPGTIVQGVTITGNHIYSDVTTATSLITFVGGYNEISSIHIGKNSYVMDGKVVNAVNGGNSFRPDCFIDDSFVINGASPFINLGNARTLNKILYTSTTTVNSTGNSSVVIITVNDDFVLLNTTAGSIECILPDASLCKGKRLIFKRMKGRNNDAKISPFSAKQLLDNSENIILRGQDATLTVQSTGVSWYIVDLHNPIITTSSTDVVTKAFLNTNYPYASFPVGTTVYYYMQNKKFERVSSTEWVSITTALTTN